MHPIRQGLMLAAFTASSAWAANTLTVCTEANPDGFDVVQYNALVTTNASADALMNRLVDYDPDSGKVVPSLASSWRVSPDGRAYTFTLRADVSFHSTDYFKPSRKLTADDVVFTFERMLNPANPWNKISTGTFPHATSLQLPSLIQTVRALDSHTVQFILSRPESTFLSTLSMGFASIYSAEYANQLMSAGKPQELNSKPIGTGPFVFKSYIKDSTIRYSANPSYFAGRAKVDQLIFAVTPSPSVRLQKLKAGECQIALSPTPQDVLSARGDTALKVQSSPAFMTAFVAMNSQKKPFDNPLVRRAVNLAFDHASYLSAVFGGTATEAVLPYPPNTWGYARNLKPWPHDIAGAKKLLAQAGYPQGFDTTIWVRPSGSMLNPNPRAGAELLQADLTRVGIRAKVQVIEWGELIRRGKAGEHDMLFMGWAGDNGDPDNFLTPQFSCAAVKSGTNFARYCDPKLDKLISAGKTSSDIGQRSRNYLAAQKIIHDQTVWLPLAHPTLYVMTAKRIGGYRVNPFGRQDFSHVSIK
ncbi:ABC transporter substrate-binding protein [Paludibacterium purpuratum]|uniref:Peptide/nickel transport system substrate-binding protein/dipeptide transport system substrate-binding protein n=1 Tax=Paludibacterium purpuratum TaxID=1144873 RepID=A0A4R7BGB7_9NEIS|nr:ABC transporter substrate-binding protein [Paludibacterium purpuratum]TDR82807.1 peptide/nickel transport system substrate-binding protein/dipeptide transport system substrate-binding protein [Paludibacterium purpuratum]